MVASTARQPGLALSSNASGSTEALNPKGRGQLEFSTNEVQARPPTPNVSTRMGNGGLTLLWVAFCSPQRTTPALPQPGPEGQGSRVSSMGTVSPQVPPWRAVPAESYADC